MEKNSDSIRLMIDIYIKMKTKTSTLKHKKESYYFYQNQFVEGVLLGDMLASIVGGEYLESISLILI